MAKFIRWQGLIGFLVLGAAITVFVYLFAESLIKTAVVTTAESAFGAEVNVTDVKLSYSPVQLSIIEMQVTDKDSPTHNLFSFSNATAGVDIWQYFFGKTIIEALNVSDLTFAGERQSAGKVYQDVASEEVDEESLSDKAKAMLPEVDMQLPDVKALLNDSNLLTVVEGEKLKASYEEEQKKLKALKAKLPTKDKVKYYQKKVKALSKVKVESLDDIAKIQKDYEALKTEFKADQAIIKQAKQQVINSKKSLSSQVKALKQAPGKDWQQIEKTYQLESIDGEDFAHILFGEQARAYVQKAQWAYEKVSPYLQSDDSANSEQNEKIHAQGRFVHFKEDNPYPSVLVKEAKFSMVLPQGTLSIEAIELTHQHWVRGKDSLLTISSKTNGQLALESRFKISKQGEFISDGNWNIKDHNLSDKSLTSSKALSLAIDKAKLNGSGTFTLVDSNILAQNNLALSQATYQGQASSKVTNLLLDTVKSMDELTVAVEVNGEISKPEFSIQSSLTGALTGAFKKQVAAKVDEFKVKVNQGLNEKLARSLKIGNEQTAQLLDLEALLTDTDKALEDLKNSDVVKQQKQKLKDKLKNKAKDKLEDKLKEKVPDKFKKQLGDLFG